MEFDSELRSCTLDLIPVERSVINTKHGHLYNSIAEESRVEKSASTDGGCSSGVVKFGSSLSIFEWTIHHEPWHYKPNCVCHRFIHFQFSHPGESYYRKEIQWGEQSVRPKLQCSNLPVHRISLLKERHGFIEFVRDAYLAAKCSRMVTCEGLGADDVPTLSATFDWDYVNKQLESDRIASAVITFLEGVAYTHSFCLE